MKTTQRHLATLAVLTASLLTPHLAPAVPLEWTGASGVDDLWATAANWNPSGPPGAADSPIFGVTDTVGDALTVNNIVGTSITVAALSYTNSTAGTWHVTEIPSGNTLTVSGTVIVGGGTVNNLDTSAAMVGDGTFFAAGNTFTIGNAGPANPLTPGTLDLSNLSNFVYNASAGTIGIAAAGSRGMGTLTLAAISNSITAGTININGATGTSSQPRMHLGGGTNIINVNTYNVGGGRSTTILDFLGGTGGLRLRGSAGTDASRCTMTVGNRNTGGTGTLSTFGNVLFNGHPVDMKFATLTLGLMSRNGTEANFNPSGIFQFDQGTVDATTITLGVCSGNSPTSRANGTLTVGSGGSLVAGNISLANISSGVAGQGATGTLNIFGGTATIAIDVIKTTTAGSTGTVSVASGTLAVQGRVGSPANPINSLNLTNATLRLSPATGATNAVVTALTTDGAGNTIELGLMPSITSYPVTFRLIKYQGAIGGAGYNFTLSGLPGAYTGSLVDNAANSSVDLVITAGPVAQAIIWLGTTNGNWDVLTTKNWRVGTTSTNYFEGDFVTFDDTVAGTTTVTLTTDVFPGSVTYNNSSASYTLGGSGKISGLTGLTKQGSGTVVLNNSGVNDFVGAIAISGGTLQVGNGGTSGNLGGAAITLDAGLTFNRSDDTTVANVISGAASGSLTKSGAGMLTLTAANTFTGAVTVAQGTLKPGSNTALGRTNGTTTIASGATLDFGVNTLNLGLERVSVSGAGVGGNGAIINSSGNAAFSQANVAYVTLTADTTFGGTGRWDLRSANTADPAGAALSTGGNPYKLTKVGTNGVYLPGVTVDPALGDVDVQQGLLAIETATTSIGNPANNLTVRVGATLQFFNMSNRLDKVFTLNGSGTNNTVNAADGAIGLNYVVGPMALNGECWMTVNGGDFMTLSNAITGGGGDSFVKQGGGTLYLSGPTKAYSGNTTVSNGTLVLNTILNGGGTLTILTNTTLTGTGTNTGPVILGGSLTPGSSAGTFGSGSLTLNAGATVAFELNSVNTIGSGVNDLLEVNGNLTVNDNSFAFSMLNLSLQAGSYRLINYTGSLIGNLNTNASLAGGASRYSLAIDTNTPGQVNLVVGGSTGNLRWDSNANTTWDIATTSNWFNTGTSAPDAFYQGDSVLFSDADYTGGGPVVSSIDIAAGAAVSPSTLTNNSTANQFIISGPGKISGGALIDKTGDSVLTLSSTNDFTGMVIIEQGTIKVGTGSALGNIAGGTLVKDGATLDFNAVNIGQEPVTVSGTGVSGAGALYNSAGQVFPAIARVTLAGDTTVGGVGRWDLRSATTGDPSQSSLLTGGQPYKITKVGANQVSIVGTTVDPALGDIDVQQGTFSLEVATTGAGNPLSNLTVQAGATLQMFNLATPLNKRITFSDANYNNDSGANVIVGPVALNGGCTFDIDAGTSLTISNVVSGTGSLTRSADTGTLSLSAANTYSGDTAINFGTLALVGNGSIANSPNITLATATTFLDVSGRSDATLSLSPGQKLAGDGTVRGSLVVGAGTVAPGNSAGRLTVTNAVICSASSTNVMEVDKSSFTNDVLSAASITYGGTLQMSAITLPFAVGDSFKLFNASSYSGAFAAIDPATPGAGLAWDTGDLTTSGTLNVVSTGPVSQPDIATFSYSGTDVTLNGTNGPAYALYQLLASTNISLPFTNWTPLRTNYFDGTGSFSEAGIPVDPNESQRYYLIRIQIP